MLPFGQLIVSWWSRPSSACSRRSSRRAAPARLNVLEALPTSDAADGQGYALAGPPATLSPTEARCWFVVRIAGTRRARATQGLSGVSRQGLSALSAVGEGARVCANRRFPSSRNHMTTKTGSTNARRDRRGLVRRGAAAPRRGGDRGARDGHRRRRAALDAALARDRRGQPLAEPRVPPALRPDARASSGSSPAARPRSPPA